LFSKREDHAMSYPTAAMKNSTMVICVTLLFGLLVAMPPASAQQVGKLYRIGMLNG
jgi:hypothetical protein